MLLATAMTLDVDYFSRHSGHGGGSVFPFMPAYASLRVCRIGSMLPFMIPFPGGGGANQGDQEVQPTAEDSRSDTSPYLGGNSTGELPRSASADQAAEERSWDDQVWSGESDIPMEEGEMMQDPWATQESDDQASWSDFFGDGDGE